MIVDRDVTPQSNRDHDHDVSAPCQCQWMTTSNLQDTTTVELPSNNWICPMGWTYEGAKHPVTRRSRASSKVRAVYAVHAVRCFVTPQKCCNHNIIINWILFDRQLK